MLRSLRHQGAGFYAGYQEDPKRAKFNWFEVSQATTTNSNNYTMKTRLLESEEN